MIYPENPSLSDYLMKFMFYTLGAVGLIYSAFWYLRQKMGRAQRQPHQEMVPTESYSEPHQPSALPPNMPLGLGTGLEVESVLPMENQQSLYVLRAGRERFLISVSGDKTTLLSKLESASVEELVQASGAAQLPWFTAPSPEPHAPAYVPRASASSRFLQSISWLVSARSGSK